MRTIFPLILRLLLDKRVPLKLKAIPFIAILYVLLPFDFLPDLIPFIGWIDDLAVVVISILTFLLYASSAKLLGNGKEGDEQAKRDSRKGKVVNGEYRLIDDDENP